MAGPVSSTHEACLSRYTFIRFDGASCRNSDRPEIQFRDFRPELNFRQKCKRQPLNTISANAPELTWRYAEICFETRHEIC